MRIVLKSYMKSFFKNWVETFGSIIFLLTLTAIIVGMLASPLQISLKASGVKNKSKDYDLILNDGIKSLEDDFLINYVYNKNGLNSYYELLDGIEGGIFTEDFVNSFSESELIPTLKQTILKEEKMFDMLYKLQLGTLKPDEKSNFTNSFLNILEPYNYSFSTYLNKNVLVKQKSKLENIQFSVENTVSYNQNGKIIYNFFSSNNSIDLVTGKTTDFGKLVITEGRNVNSIDEVVLSEKFATSNQIKVGDKFSIKDLNLQGSNAPNTELTVVGIGSKYETLTPGSNFTMFAGGGTNNYAYLFVQPELIEKIWKTHFEGNASKLGEFKYINVNRIVDPKNQLYYLFAEDPIRSVSIYKDNNLIFQDKSDYTTIHKLEVMNLQVLIYIILGILILLLSFLFLNFIIKKELVQSRVQLGIFKAFGYYTHELSWIFALKTFITNIIGIFIGYFLSIPLQMFMAKQFSNVVSFDFDTVFLNFAFLAIIWLVIPAFFMLISYALTIRYLWEPALGLITGARRIQKSGIFLKILSWVIFPIGVISTILKYSAESLKRRNRGFTWRLQQSFTRRSVGKFAMITSLFVFSSFLFLMQISSISVMSSLTSGGFDFYNPKTDHEFQWQNHGGNFKTENISTSNWEDPKTYFVLQDKEWEKGYFEIIDYKGTENVNDFIETYNPEGFEIGKKINNVMRAISDAMYGETNKNDLTSLALIPFITPLSIFNVIKEDQVASKEDIYKIVEEYFKENENQEGESNYSLEDDFLLTYSGVYNNGEKNIKQVLPLKMITQLICITQASTLETGSPMVNCNDPKNWRYLFDLSKVSSNISGSSGFDIQALLGNSAAGLLQTATILADKKGHNPLFTTNELYFDSSKELLSQSIPTIFETDKGKKIESSLFLNKYKTIDSNGQDVFNMYGDITKIYNFSSISENDIAKLYEENQLEALNAIVPASIAKIGNLKVGDIFSVKANMRLKEEVKLKVVAINQSVLTGGAIYLDYDNFFNKYGDPSQREMLIKNPPFNYLSSQKPSLDGEISITNLGSNFSTMSNYLDNMSIGMTENKALLASILDLSKVIDNILPIELPNIPTIPSWVQESYKKIRSDLVDFVEKNQDLNFEILTDSSFTQNNEIIKFLPITIFKKGALAAVATTNAVMIIFMILVSLLLLIILVVIMNIVIDEASAILLTMRAIGYKNMKVNWIVMGNYIIWSIIGFIGAYLASIITWIYITSYVWDSYNILVNVPLQFSTPLFAFITLAAIMFIGWFCAMTAIKKRPLTRITS